MNAPEDVESRLERLKLETPVIEQLNERLENNKANVSNKLAAEAVADSEVSNIIESTLNFIHRLPEDLLMSSPALYLYSPSWWVRVFKPHMNKRQGTWHNLNQAIMDDDYSDYYIILYDLIDSWQSKEIT